MSARLFVAVDVAAGDRVALARWAREAVGEDAGLRLVPAEDIHLTMAFLGHRSLDEVDPLASLVASMAPAGEPVPLRAAGALWLSPRRPHVLTVAVEDVTGALERLHDRLWNALEEGFGVVRDRRRFRPHLTVARIRRGWSPPRRRLAPAPQLAMAAETLVLYRSHLGDGPARYEAVESVGLA